MTVTFEIYELVQNEEGEWVWLMSQSTPDACSAVEICKSVANNNPGYNAKVFKVITEETYSIGNWHGDMTKRFKKVHSMGKPIPPQLKRLLEKYLRDGD